MKTSMVNSLLENLIELERLLNYREPTNVLLEDVKPQILQGYKENKPTVKEAIIANLYKYFEKFDFVKNIKLIGERLQFWISKSRLSWLEDWEKGSNALKQGSLRVFKYNSSGGYLIEIQ